mgnify:CR=1 FL=1
MDIEKYLSNFFKGTKNPSLKAMKFLMDEFKHPEDKIKTIHIAGTNGKGSATEMITNVLINEGYTVGKFISPHLIHYNERISVNNNNISNIEMEELIEKINPAIEKYNSTSDVSITLFELETTMAFLYFEQKKCDFVVLETGLGGMYDCTNIINHPLVSIITSIGYDHMNILGNTLPEIAYQKAGIIKRNSHTVIFEEEPEIDNVFISECKKKNSILRIVKKKDIFNYSFDDNYQYFDYKNFKAITINLKGKVQIKNACLCLETFNILNELGYHVNMISIQKGLSTVIHKGRMEQINDNPIIIYDGAHNEPAIKNFQDMVKMYYNKMKRVYIISILKRKDYNKMLKLIAQDKEAKFILTSGNNSETYASGDELFECIKQFTEIDKIYKKNLDDAIKEALNSNIDTVNFVIGSFYTYGTVIDIIQKNK